MQEAGDSAAAAPPAAASSGDAGPRFLFVGCYTTPGLRWVGTDPGTGITTLRRHPETGAWVQCAHIEQDNPSWLEPHPHGTFLVATHESGPQAAEHEGFVSSYRVDEETGELALVCRQKTGGRGNTAVEFDRPHRFLLVTRYWDAGVCVLPFHEDGTIGEVAAAVTHEGKGPHPIRQSGPHPHGFVADPVSDLVYALDLGCDKVFQYSLDATTGALTPAAVPIVDMPEGSGPRGMKFHPQAPHLAFVNCELGGTIVVCDVDPTSGLTPRQQISTYPEAYSGGGGLGKADRWGAELAIHPNGRVLYALNRVHNSVCILAVTLPTAPGPDPSKGAPAPASVLAVRGFQELSPGNARNLTLDQSGRLLFVASQDTNLVEAFAVSPDTGRLSALSQTSCPCPTDVAVWP